MSVSLGEACQITLGTNNVEESMQFYTALGFRILAENSHPYPWKKITDNSCTLLLMENGSNYVGVSYFDPEMDKTVKLLQKQDIRFVQMGYKENIFISPDDTIFTLVLRNMEEIVLPFTVRDEQTVLPLPNSTLGIFRELTIPVANLEMCLKYYQQLNFEILEQTNAHYPYARTSDGKIVLGLHETPDLDNHVITYHVPNLKELENTLTSKGIDSFSHMHGKLAAEEPHLAIRTPENLQILVFEF